MSYSGNLTYSASPAELIFPDHTFSVTLAGATVTSSVKSFSISGSRGQAMTGSIVLLDYTGMVAELVNQYRTTLPHNRSTGPEIVFSITVGGVSPTYPTFVVTGISGETEITLSFSDKTPYVDLDYQSIADILADAGDIATGTSVMALLAALVAVGGVTVSYPSGGWNVRTFRMNDENVMSKMDELAAVTRSYRRWEGNTLIYEELGDNADSSTFTDRYHILEGSFSMNYSMDGVKTYFEAERLAPQPALIASPFRCVGNQCIGRTVNISFSRPASNVKMEVVSVENGAIVEGVFFDAAGDPLNVVPADTWIHGVNKAHRWEATYEPTIGTFEYEPQYLIHATGRNSAITEAGNFNVNAAVAALETKFGRRPEFGNLATELILDEATMQTMLDNLAIETKWSAKKYNFSSPFVSAGLCGSSVLLTNYRAGVSGESTILEDFTHSWSAEDGWDCNYSVLSQAV